MNDLNREAALRSVRARLSVFPCELEAKRPCYGVRFTCMSVRNESGIAYHWAKFPDARPAINLGGVGLIVIDLDRGHDNGADGVAEFERLLDQHGELPAGSPMVRTPSGGLHIYFKQIESVEPIGNSASRVAPGIDVRGYHGFVVAPGAVNADGTFYESIPGTPDLCEAFMAGSIPEIPQWLAELAEKPAHLTVPARDPCAPAAVACDRRPYALTILKGEAIDLANAPVGSRNATLNKAAFVIASKGGAWDWVSEGEAWDALWSACVTNGYIADDGPKAFKRTFYSGWNDGLSKPTSPRERLIPNPVFAARIANLNAHRA